MDTTHSPFFSCNLGNKQRPCVIVIAQSVQRWVCVMNIISIFERPFILFQSQSIQFLAHLLIHPSIKHACLMIDLNTIHKQFDDYHFVESVAYSLASGQFSTFLSIRMSFILEPWTMSQHKNTFHYHTTSILVGAANQMNKFTNVAGMDLCVEWNDVDDRQKHIPNEHKLSSLFGMFFIANVLTLNAAAVLFCFYLLIGIALHWI